MDDTLEIMERRIANEDGSSIVISRYVSVYQ